MKRKLSKQGIIKRLVNAIKREAGGSQRAYARMYGLHQQSVNRAVKHGNFEPSVLAAIGAKKVIIEVFEVEDA